MIRVTIEMIPHGREARARHMATIEIANDNSGTVETGNYTAELSKVNRLGRVRVHPHLWKRARVVNFPRGRLTVYDLLFRVLQEAVGERNST
jgi:hypothetical protein